MVIIYIALLALFLFLLPRLWHDGNWYKGLSAKVYFKSGSIFEGEKDILYEEVENAKLFPVPMIKVKFETDRNLLFEDEKNSSVTDLYYRNDIFSMKGNQRIKRQLAFTGGKRGFYKIGDITLVCSDLFLTRQDVLEFTNSSSLYVYPRRLNNLSFEELQRELSGEVLARSHTVPDPFEYRGIREYEPYDSMKSVNWKASAKTGELKVNLKGYTSIGEVRIFLDLYNYAGYRKDDMKELSICAAAGLAEDFCRREMRVSIRSNGKTDKDGKQLWMPPDMGQSFMENVYRAFARLDLALDIPNFEESMGKDMQKDFKNAYTIVISSDAGGSLQKALLNFTEKSTDFTWIYVLAGVEEPQIFEGLRPYIKYVRGEE